VSVLFSELEHVVIGDWSSSALEQKRIANCPSWRRILQRPRRPPAGRIRCRRIGVWNLESWEGVGGTFRAWRNVMGGGGVRGKKK